MSCRYTQSCVDSLPQLSFFWAVDFDALRLQCSSSEGLELDQTFATLGELEEVYRARVVPLYRDEEGGCVDVDRGAEVTSVPDLAGRRRPDRSPRRHSRDQRPS